MPSWRAARPETRARWIAAGFFLLALTLQLPGNVPYDGIVVWHEAETHRLYAQHPAALVLIWRLCEFVLRGPALLTTLSLACLWGAIAILLARLHPPVRAALVFCACVLLWPPLLAGAGVAVKDVLGAHLALLAFALGLERRWFWAVAAGTLAALLRYQFALVLPVLMLLWWPHRAARSGILAVAALVLTVGAVSAGVSLLFVKTGPGDVMLSLRKMAVFDIAGTVAHDPSTPLAVLERHGVAILPLKTEMRARYSPVRVDTLWQDEKSDGTITPSSGVFGRLYAVPDKLVFGQWEEVIGARPGAFLAHRMAAYGRVLGFGDIWQCRPVTPGISWLPHEPALAVGAKSYPAPLSAKIMSARAFPVSLTFRAAPYLAVLLIVLVWGAREERLLAGFAFGYSLSFFFLPQACEVRYAYPVMLFALVAGAMTLRRRFI